MNYNIIGYLIYGIFTSFTIFYVGKVLHRNGRYFVLRVIQDEDFGDFVNDGLLMGYYLVNLGYTLFAIITWSTILNAQELLEVLSFHIGSILLFLGGLHFTNILLLRIYATWNGINFTRDHLSE